MSATSGGLTLNIIGKPSAIGDLSAIFAAAEVNRCSSPAISPAAAAPMSEVIDRTKVKKSPTAAINGRRRMLDPHNVRAATRDKRPPAKTVDQAALPMLVKERRTSPIAQEGRMLPIAQAFVLVKEGRTSLTAEALIAVWAAYEHRPAVFGSGAADLAVAVLAVEVVVLVVEVVASVAVVAALGARISGSSTTSSLLIA